MRLVVSVGCDWLDRVEMQCLDEVWSVFKWLINFWISFGIRILRTLAALLKVEMENRPEEITLTSSGLFLEGLIFLLPRSFLRRSFLWLWIFCSNVFSLFFCGLLSAYWAKSVSLSFSVPKFRIYVMRTIETLYACRLLCNWKFSLVCLWTSFILNRTVTKSDLINTKLYKIKTKLDAHFVWSTLNWMQNYVISMLNATKKLWKINAKLNPKLIQLKIV